MTAEGYGWWRTQAARATEGYGFSLDGGPARPDPRSRWQPQGVHGLSQHVDLKPLAPFRPVPWRESVVYEMHLGTFTPEGTYRSAQAKIPHLKGLGITHLELLPLATFPGQRGWGYDGVDLFAPHPAYGSPSELQDFIGACHEAGIAVLIDVVYNHLGPDGNYLDQFGPYFTGHYKTGWGEAVNYDGPGSDEVRRFVIDNALMWLGEYGFDGLRLDAVHAIYCFSASHVLEELVSAVRVLGERADREFVLIAESDLNDPRLVIAPSAGGMGLDAHWQDDFHHAMHAFFTGERSGYYADFGNLAQLATALRDGYVYQGQYSQHRQRRHGRRPRKVRREQLVVAAQNHDQIGNRAQGERLSMLLDAGKLKAIAALTLLSPFVPMLFQGEEWGATTPFLYFTDHQDEALGRLVAEGRTREFAAFKWQGEVPNPQAPETFTRSKLDWSELDLPAHAELLAWHRALISLRHAHLARSRGRPKVRLDSARAWLSYEFGDLLIRCNFAPVSQKVPMAHGRWRLALDSDPEDGEELPPGATRIYTAGV